MKIIIAPAKKMKIEEDMSAHSTSELLDHTKEILKVLQSKDQEALKKLWHCNDKLVTENYDRLQRMDLDQSYSPAIYSYAGIQYQYLSVNTLETEALDYLQSHLRILSGFYGVLKPFDAVTPYRLEMCQKLSVNHSDNLYDYWKDLLYKTVNDSLIINLSSSEYSQCIEKYLKETDLYITIHFGEIIDQKFKTKGTIAKMARGEMVRYMAIHQIEDINDIKAFHELDFRYDDTLSDSTNYYFVRGKKDV